MAQALDRSTELERALKLAELVESSSDAVVGLSPAGLIVSWSGGAEGLFGYSRAEAVGRHVMMLSPVDRAQETRELLARVLGGDIVERVETERIAKGGRLLKVLLSISPVWGAGGELAGVAAIVRDLSEQRRTEDALRVSEERYRQVVEALDDGVVMQDADGHLLAFNKSAERILGLSAAQLAASSSYQPVVRLIHEDGSPFLGHEHPTMVSLRTGEPQSRIVMGVESPDGSLRWVSINSCALRRPGESKPYAAVGSFADITAYRHTVDELQAARIEDLRRLALVAEYRDDDTHRHTERVARTTELLARELGLNGELVWTIRQAAPLHDVGKIGIPDNILLKPGKLTIEEFEVMKTHTVIGARILGESHFPILQMGAEIALTHHERWDGTGYPAGLQKEAIPVTGRITSVADAFDAMTHARSYKNAYPVERAIAEINRSSATQFDPHIVEAFMTLDHSELVDTA